VSAVIHRDQKEAHLHALALPVLDGVVDGREMKRGDWGVPKLRDEFLAHMLKHLGLHQGVQENPLTALALTSGRGAKTHEDAARRDEALQGHAKRVRKRGDIERGHQTNVPCVSGPMSSNGHHLPGGWLVANGRDLCWLMMAC